MSITDEGTRPSSAPAASDNLETTSSEHNGAGQPAQGLPGLAGFGQMQGYAPVTDQPQEAEVPVEAVAEPEIPAGVHDTGAAQDYPLETQNYAEPADAGDNTGTEPSYAGEATHGYMPGQHEQQDDTPHDDALHDDALYNTPAGEFEAGAAHPSDPAYQGEGGNTLQTFEAHYDQYPEIPLGAIADPGEPQGDQPFFHEPGQAGDAEFLGAESAPDVAAPKERRIRKILMASSGLIGVLALGGALAFAYKIGGESDIASTGKPPLIQADSRPVKVAPDKPGGKQFPHKNKKIYERLQGEKSQEVEKLVPRQEDVAAAATVALVSPQPAKSSAAQQFPAPAVSQSPNGTPRKVKTLTVRPDGTIEAANPRQKVVKAPPAPATTAGSVAMSFPQPVAAPASAPVPAPAKQALAPSIPAAARVAVTPPPVQKPAVPRAAPSAPAPQRTAALPASAPVASSSNYVVQVASRKSQTDALAAFADIQQKYPRLLSGYRPIIKRTDLGSKGIWYRLTVGPVEGKKVASSLCKSLKGAGMRSCIVRAQ